MMNAGIDPGKWKIGVAFAEDETLLFSAIIPVDEIETLYEAFASSRWSLLKRFATEGAPENLMRRELSAIFIGDGTSSSKFREAFPVPHRAVSEYGTTLAARGIYWRLHAPSGLCRLVPLSMRTPPRNIDDLAAYAIILRAQGGA